MPMEYALSTYLVSMRNTFFVNNMDGTKYGKN